jgi:GPH family glycoside/pentoside/hexuronide:cation symporter
VSQTWTLWLVYFYAPPADADNVPRISEIGGIDDRVALGAVLTLARLIEALDDPLIGYWSDRTSSRWGRRIPFILFGTPAWVVMFVLLFLPPAEGAAGANLVYIFFAAQVFYLLSNLSGAPIEALLPSVAPRTDDRLSIAQWQVLFGVTGALIGLTLSSLLRGAFGFVTMAVIIGAIALTARYASLFAIWRRAKQDRDPARRGFTRALRETFSNPHLLAYLPSFVLFQVGLQLLTALIPFYVDAVLFDSTLFSWTGSEDEGVFAALLTATVIAGMLCGVPVFARLAARGGKAAAYRKAMLGVSVIFPLLFFAGFVPGVPELPQTLVMLFVAGVPVAGVFLFPNIITADIVDEDATRRSTRREAMIYGSQNQVEKLATALSPLLFAIILLAGDSAEDPGGIRLVGPVAGLLVFTGWLAFRRYHLEEGALRPAAVS